MINKTPEPNKPIRVYLSYSWKDKAEAKKIADFIRKSGISVGFDEEEIKPGESWLSQLDSQLNQSDYILVLLSPNSIKSNWTKYINEKLTRDLILQEKRIIPILISTISYQDLPSSLLNIQAIDLRNNYENNLFHFIEQISNATNVDFSHLDGSSFERLISDLLNELGFLNIKNNVKFKDYSFDITAEYNSIDPFHAKNNEKWIIECKLYKNEKADLKSIYQLTTYLLNLPENYRAALITNGQLTSTSLEWLKKTEYRYRIRIVDGYELKNLVLRYPIIIKKFFTTNTKGV